MATTSGIASPSACGQEITNTVTARPMTVAPDAVAIAHATAVTPAEATAT